MRLLRPFAWVLERFGKVNAVFALALFFIVCGEISAWMLYLSEHNTTFTVHDVQTKTVEVTVEGQKIERIVTVLAPRKEQGLSVTDAHFASYSALCVTGLITRDTSELSGMGQAIIVVTIKLGGLGISFAGVLFIGFVALRLSRKGALHSLMSETHGTIEWGQLALWILALQTALEFCGAGILFWRFQFCSTPQQMQEVHPLWAACFLSVSAVNNAGFSPFRDNLMSFSRDSFVLGTVGWLLVLGGIGFNILIHHITWVRIWMTRDGAKKMLLVDQVESYLASPLLVRITWCMTLGLQLIGWLPRLWIEWDAPALAGFSGFDKTVLCWFHSVSPRTAGFNAIDMSLFQAPVRMLDMILMHIGACPGSTGGGIKVTVAFLLYTYYRNMFRSYDSHMHGFGRAIDRISAQKALRTFVFSIAVVAAGVFLVAFFENGHMRADDKVFTFEKNLYEVVSACGTVGLSLGAEGIVTSYAGILTEPSRWVLILMMFIGRVGYLNIVTIFAWFLPWSRTELKPSSVPEDVAV